MKKIKIDKEHFKRVLILALVMSATFIVLELYVPGKRLLVGDKLLFSEIWKSIDFGHYLPYILICSLAFGLYAGNPEDKKTE
jgi:hypothetical protein